MTTQFWRKLWQIKFWQSTPFAFIASLIVFAGIIPLLPLHLARANTPENVQFVDPAWVTGHTGDYNLRILDVHLNPLNYITEHIPNAVHIADNTFRELNKVKHLKLILVESNY